MSDAPNVTTAPLAIGRYQVTDTLGEGGMGVVYLARDPHLERFVAIKLLRAGFDTSDMRERFGREARAVAALRHPYIVTLFEYGEHHGQPFIVMEYVSGKTLGSLIASRTPMSLVRRLKLLEDLCDGLDHAHKRGIIHRDVKPANIMVDAEGTLQILDFGIAKQDHGTNATQSNVLAGTPKYMSPEQISGKVVTRRSDVFSVGLVAYELFTGEPAFPATSHYAAMDAILNHEPRPIEAHVPSIDPRIVRIVTKSLEKDPDRRYQDLAQMRRDVERIRLELALAARSQDSTTVPQPTSLPDLAERRQQQIAANLETADRAFELGDFEAALVACEDVLIIDPQNARAHEGRGRAHAALTERQAFAHLNLGRQHLSRGEFTLAEAALQAALAIVPGLGEGIELREELGSARQQQEQRIRALNLAIDRARVRFQEGAFESAIDAANEALEYSPADSEARRLKAEAVIALDERRRQQEIARRAQSAADEAARLSARDRYADALRVLDDPLIAGHPTARQARVVVEAAQAEFSQLTAAAEERARIALADTVVVRAEDAIETSPADAVTFQTPETLPLPAPIAIAPSTVDRAGTPVQLGIAHVGGGYLWGPVRARRPKPMRRPVRFEHIEMNRAGARDWLDGQRFAGVTQGRGSISFGISLTTHLILATTGVMFVLARASAPPPPPTPTMVSVLAEVPPPPPQTPDPPPQRMIERPRQVPVAAPVPRHARPVITPPGPELHDNTPKPTVTPLDHISTTSGLPNDLTHADVLTPPGPPLPQGTSDPAPGDFTPVTDFDQRPVLQKKVEPKLPAGASGNVRVEVTIVPDGHVSRVKVLDPTPYASLIAEAASNCVFRPAKRRGKAVTVVMVILFQFDTRK